MSGYVLILVCLGTYRIVRLLGQDTITEPFREALGRWADRSGVGQWFEELVLCPWCLSVEVGIVVAWTATWASTSTWWLVVMAVCAGSTFTGVLATLLRWLERTESD